MKFAIALVYYFAITVTDTDGNTSAYSNEVSKDIIEPDTANLSWEAPTLNVDGTPIVGIAGYDIHLGTASRRVALARPVLGAMVVLDDDDPGILRRVATQDLGRSVRAPIEDEDRLEIRVVLRSQRRDALVDDPLLVVRRHDDAERRPPAGRSRPIETRPDGGADRQAAIQPCADDRPVQHRRQDEQEQQDDGSDDHG